ncbi:MAG: DUF2004 domain-containing protein [Dysgonomonas sp.]|nr:DUF2004 domain-containing protein [Dysgonomonas sp.]
MSKQKLPYFEDIIDWNDLEDYYETEINFHNHTTSIDLNLDDEPQETWAEDYNKFMGKFEEYYQSIKKTIKGYYPEEGMVKEYYTYHLEEISEEMAEELEKTDKTLSEDERLHSILKLDRIGFYFAEDNFATWDFSFGDFTDQILVIYTDKEGEIEDISWES